MAETTLDERAERFIDRLGDLFFQYSLRPAKFKLAFMEEIRAAVAAETEWCIQTVKMKCRTAIICQLFADGEADQAGREIAAAIRREAEPDDG